MFVSFLTFGTEIRRVICSTGAFEPVNARDPCGRPRPRALIRRGHRTDARPHGADVAGPRGKARHHWKAPPHAGEAAFGGRPSAART